MGFTLALSCSTHKRNFVHSAIVISISKCISSIWLQLCLSLLPIVMVKRTTVPFTTQSLQVQIFRDMLQLLSGNIADILVVKMIIVFIGHGILQVKNVT